MNRATNLLAAALFGLSASHALALDVVGRGERVSPMTRREAMARCEQIGRRLPTYAEAKRIFAESFDARGETWLVGPGERDRGNFWVGGRRAGVQGFALGSVGVFYPSYCPVYFSAERNHNFFTQKKKPWSRYPIQKCSGAPEGDFFLICVK